MDEGERNRIDEFWGKRLGCEPALLRTPGLHVIPPDPGTARPSIFLLACSGALLLRGEPGAARTLAAHLAMACGMPEAGTVTHALSARVARIVGPAFLGYRSTAPGSTIDPSLHEVRALAATDTAALSRLRSAVTVTEWEHAGQENATPSAPRIGVFDGERLLAVAAFEILLGTVAHVGVLTHPAARGRGAGRTAAAAAVRAGLAAGLLVQYQTLERNGPSMRIAAALGFSRWGTSLAVRLMPDAELTR